MALEINDPVQLSKGINLSELLTSNVEFHIDMDFKKNKTNTFSNCDDEFFPDMDEGDSDGEDVLKIIEKSTDKMMLTSPEYHSFEQLASKMIDCVSSGDVKILIIEEGDGPLVPVDAEVTMHYAAYWEKAKIAFDSSLTTDSSMPKRIRLGAGRIIPGLEIGLSMVKGPKARFHLLVQPAAAWGPIGVPPRIRPEPALFVIVLYDVKDNQAAVRFNDLPKEEQSKFETTVKTVKALRADAKDFFTKHKYRKAFKNYQMAMSVLSMARPDTEAESDELKNIKVQIYVNLIVCYSKLDKPKYVLNMCENLDNYIDVNKHCKVQFYCGRAYEALGNNDLAVAHYKKALKLEPKNKEIGNKLAELDARTKTSIVTEKEMWQKALKSVPVEKKIVYDVDEEFQNVVLEMCHDLARRDEHTKIELPTGLTHEEINCMKDLMSGFDGLILDVEGKGTQRKVTIIKK